MAFTLNDLPSLVQSVGGLFDTYQGASYQADGYDLAGSAAIASGDYAANLAIQGGNISAGAYRAAGKAAIATANYNIALNKVQETRKEQALSQELNSINSTNRALAGGTGISISSKSNLAIMNANIHAAENAVLQYRNTATQQQLNIAYEGQLANTQYENQARQAAYNAQVSAQESQYQAEVQKVGYDYKAAGANYKGNTALLNGAVKIGTTLLGGS